MDEGIMVIEQGRVIEIHIDRPHKKNALTGAMYRAMMNALADASARPDIAAVLLAGRGETFSAGNDLPDFLSGPDGSSSALDFVRAIAAFDKPIVAAVQGMAVGIGMTMLFHCDLIYAAPDARFQMPFVNLGLSPEAGASLLAPAILGSAKAAAMLLLGEGMDAQAAERSGFVTAIIAADMLLDHARAKAAALAAQPQTALAATRQLMRPDPALIAKRIEEEASIFVELLQSEDAKEAFTAFLEKRKPSFRS